MPLRTLPSGERYALLAFDENGVERDDDADGVGGKLSARILADISGDAGVTDVFVFSHGWNGDVADAIRQYDLWFGAMAARTADRAAMAAHRPGFAPYRIGLHWPSKAWGDEAFGAGSFAVGVDPAAEFARMLGDRPGLKANIDKIFAEAARNPSPPQLPPNVEQAYREIDDLLSELVNGREGAAPGSDRGPFDPQACYAGARGQGPASFGGGHAGDLLGPLRVLSFWKMKQRACSVGKSGAHDFVRALQGAAAGRPMHAMGHSFGCILSCALIAGPAGGTPLAPVASLALLQGAMSVWSMCDDIPVNPGLPGYFRRVRTQNLVRGATLTTRSRFDTANRVFYPLGAGVAGQVQFDVRAAPPMPRYGAIGSFGLLGLTPAGEDRPMLPADGDYRFAPGGLYNLEASDFVRNGGGVAGAHNDIGGAEVAHALWSAALIS